MNLKKTIIGLSFLCIWGNVRANPRISIITSIYKGDAYIKHFLEDITQQTIFNECELLLINANSPGNEEQVILEFTQKYPNIIYQRLEKDPGLYACWNIAIKMASGDYIINANIDDALANNAIEKFANTLDKYPHIDLVYADYYVTYKACGTFANHSKSGSSRKPQFSVSALRNCIATNHPMWRKNIHEKYGYFDESFKICGDWEMWVRSVLRGSRFKKINGHYGLYYKNPTGLSTAQHNLCIRRQEEAKIRNMHKKLWGK